MHARSTGCYLVPFCVGCTRSPLLHVHAMALTRCVEPQEQRDRCAFLSQPNGSWINTIPEAPVFHPTAAEWADPVAYLARIQEAFKHAGICRIVPPCLPAVPGPHVLAQNPTWRYNVRQQYLGNPWSSFQDAHNQIWQSHK